MSDCGLSQSELARRVHVSQQSIHKLLNGDSRGSRYLHKIARELHTTPAFLTGEVDDPVESAPPEPQFSWPEHELVSGVRELDPRDRSALLRIVDSLRPRAQVSPPPLPDEDALAQMFEALLMAMDRSAPLAEQALLLAQRLPIGLSQLQDLLPPEPSAQPASTTAARVQPMPEVVPQ